MARRGLGSFENLKIILDHEHSLNVSEPANQASKMSSALPKRISPQTTPHMPSSNGIGATELRPDNQAIRNQPNPLTDTPSCYNSRLFRSIVKGASDFKCKHCGESFTKLECLTKHMYSKELDLLIEFRCHLNLR